MDEQTRQTLFDLWRILSQGGWVMGAIFVAGQIGWFFVMERWWHYRRLDADVAAFWNKAPEDPDRLAESLV
jgi:hypothetical protein